MKSMQYSPYLRPNHRNFRVLQEIVVEENDGDVIPDTNLAMGQIPRSTERIASFGTQKTKNTVLFTNKKTLGLKRFCKYGPYIAQQLVMSVNTKCCVAIEH